MGIGKNGMMMVSPNSIHDTTTIMGRAAAMIDSLSHTVHTHTPHVVFFSTHTRGDYAVGKHHCSHANGYGDKNKNYFMPVAYPAAWLGAHLPLPSLRPTCRSVVRVQETSLILKKIRNRLGRSLNGGGCMAE